MAEKTERRSLKYIRLAAFLAKQPSGIDRIVMTLAEVERIVGETLPPNARFPSWWKNDPKRMHSRAWLTAGWQVEGMASQRSEIEFIRSHAAPT